MKAIAVILTFFISLFPTSPFEELLEKIELHDILGSLNYFVPFDIFATCINAWIGCVVLYMIFDPIVRRLL